MQSAHQYQKGVILLTLVIMIALAAITYYLVTLSPVELKLDRQQQTRAILKEAKQGLISYAVTYADRGNAGKYGDLPCTDASSNQNIPGQSDITCGSDAAVSTIGYFPWRSLGIDVLRDYSGACLFFAVSPYYKPTTHPLMLNEDTNGLIQIVDKNGTVIEGASPASRPVAVIFAAGEALDGQNRMRSTTTVGCTDYNNVPAYLDSAYLDSNGITENSTAVTPDNTIRQFIAAYPGSANMSPPLNDQLITVSRDDIWKAIVKRTDFKNKMNNLTQAIALCLANYAADNTYRRLPWPAPVDLLGADYRDNSSYKDATGGLYAGRLPYDVSNSSAAAGIVNTTLFNATNCNSLPVGSGTYAATADLSNLTSEYGELWQNWKDHFFYAISKVYEPDSAATSETQCNNDCITVGGISYAGVVFYSGSPLSTQSRNSPFPVADNDDKADISNYLENGNDLIFKRNNNHPSGTQADAYKSSNYNVNSSGTSVDIMWCIKNAAPGSNLTVTPC